MKCIRLPLPLTKNLALLLVLNAIGYSCLAQNLVPNGSFEEGITCPSFPGNVTEECANWYGSVISITGIDPTPEWYHECSEFDAFTPPTVAFGTQEPYEGLGYVGISGYIVNEPNYREVIGVELNQPMIVGESYLVQFYISNISPENVGISTNMIGFNFSTHPFYDSSTFPPNESHFSIDTLVPISDLWYQVSEYFVADSAYSFLHIGSFFDDDNTEATPLGPTNQYAYYAVDLVSVTYTLNTEIPTMDNQIFMIYPNPSDDYISIKTWSDFEVEKVEIFDSGGSLILSKDNKSSSELQLVDIKFISTGLYFIKLVTPKTIYYDRFIKK